MVQVGWVPMAALVALVAPVAPWVPRLEPPLVELPLARPVDAWQASVDTLQEAFGKGGGKDGGFLVEFPLFVDAWKT